MYDFIDYRSPLETSPATYKSGSHRIDYVLTTRSLLDKVSGATILPLYYNMNLADHRAIMVDLDSTTFLRSQDHYSPINKPIQRGVRLMNSKVTNKYVSILSDYVTSHNMIARLDDILLENIKAIKNSPDT